MATVLFCDCQTLQKRYHGNWVKW